MERTERKGMTGIRRWVDGHTDGISDGRAVIDFAFVLHLYSYFCICMTGLRRRKDRISEGCEAIDSKGCQVASPLITISLSANM